RPFDRAGRRLAVELRADRLLRHRPGVRISGGLAHRLLELRDLLAARAGIRRCKAQPQNGDGNQSSHCYSFLTGNHDTSPRLVPKSSETRPSPWSPEGVHRTSSISPQPSSLSHVDSGGVGWSLISIIKPHFVGFGNPFS